MCYRPLKTTDYVKWKKPMFSRVADYKNNKVKSHKISDHFRSISENVKPLGLLLEGSSPFFLNTIRNLL